ncbi:hypothetical protein JX265_007933 [Neoarthrinium moseri]|uniref:Uncharacterized protein n=1 Tax=Neoarthrinium moseri TaxID=1658444 RepID=A0A9Q0AHQ3_9PEZI|nr:uncharacterized protein JN550_006521 [Neoarthrinium moseri]KAI1841308.1 hypothetical protein JX266_012462 [Neoarthrinium moseri]KAI1850482.1 hypothetical protein JX265_013444 [Neoarthrinium moseri]KAI1865610.1 hypothetical protein JX265_007933 [Neoarthrinium moseri]KAI1868033.1 hypothetical protein JN550_006521 [Neoarthrinium moseri]
MHSRLLGIAFMAISAVAWQKTSTSDTAMIDAAIDNPKWWFQLHRYEKCNKQALAIWGNEPMCDNVDSAGYQSWNLSSEMRIQAGFEVILYSEADCKGNELDHIKSTDPTEICYRTSGDSVRVHSYQVVSNSD